MDVSAAAPATHRRKPMVAYLSLPLGWFVVITSLVSFLMPALGIVVLLHVLDAMDAVPARFQGKPGGEITLPTLAESIRFLGRNVFFSPLVEAAVFHWKPLYFLSRLLRSDIAAVFVSAALFSLFHLRGSLTSCLMVAFPGLLMAFSSMYWYRRTKQTAVGYTAASSVHILHNFYYFLLSFVPASMVF